MPAPDLSAPTLSVVPWSDPVIDTMGHDPRSTYVERFWLAVLGPSTTWLVRHMARRFDAAPEGYTLHLDDTAAILGLGHTQGRHSPLARSVLRCCQFGAARVDPDGALAVRRHLPPLTRRQLDRLPTTVQSDHDRWRAVERDAATLHAQGRRARRIALALAELGEDVASTEQRLQRWRIHPVVAREAALWGHRLVAARDSDDAAVLRPQPTPRPDPELDPEPEAEAAEPRPKTERKPKPKPGRGPKAGAKPEPKAGAKPEPKAGAKPEPKAGASPDPLDGLLRPEPGSEPTPEPTTRPRSEPVLGTEPESAAVPPPPVAIGSRRPPPPLHDLGGDAA